MGGFSFYILIYCISEGTIACWVMFSKLIS
jgi:hypothetical protein